MQLLLDANISWRLISKLIPHFHGVEHVEQLEIKQPAKDLEIWDYALKNNYIIVTNDEDFLNLINLKGFPPKVVLLKTGNQSNEFICNTLIVISKI